MKAIVRTIFICLAFAAWSVSAAERTKIEIVETGKKISAKDVNSLSKCKFVYKLKAGMTNSEASDAIDAAWDKFATCLNKAART